MGSIPDMIACDGREAGLLIQHDLRQESFVDALREAMLRYMKDQVLLDEHKRNARIIFDAQFDLEKVTQQYLTFFSEAISNGKMHNGRE
jgi:glycosyltransferase involved in cell wall biosynthesis